MAKTESLGTFQVKDLEKVATWTTFAKNAEAASKANADHEKSKAAMRTYLKKVLDLEAEDEIDFSRLGDRIQVYKILEKPEGTRKKSKDLGHLLKGK